MTALDRASRRDDWDRHWDDYADVASLNPAQELRRRVILRLLALGDAPARVLDVGCGQGDLLADLGSAHPEAELHGCDISQAGLDLAQAKVPTATLFRCDLVSDDEVPADMVGWATHATCAEVLEHVDDPQRLLTRARALLAPCCRLVVTVPGGPMSRFDKHIGHRRHFTPSSLGRLLEASGFEVEKVSGVGFPMFNLYRFVVIMRGQRLVRDVARANRGASSGAARLAMRAFRLLFALGMPESRWGWQVVGVARMPSGRP